MQDKILGDGITFDDVLLVPAKSDVDPQDIDTATMLTRRVALNIPLVSAPMDTVTESSLSIALAQAGGLGIVHRNLPIDAQAMEVEVVVALQGVSVFLAKKGYLEHVMAAGLPALKDLVNNYLESGGKLLICTPCVRDRNIEESDLIEGAELIAAARLNQEILSANATLVY